MEMDMNTNKALKGKIGEAVTAALIRKVGSHKSTGENQAVPAKGMSKQEALGLSYADKIVSVTESSYGAQVGILRAVMKEDVSTVKATRIALALKIEELRDAVSPSDFQGKGANAKAKAADVARAVQAKRGSISANYSRIVTVLKAIEQGANFEGCDTLADMVSVARTHKAGETGTSPQGKKALTKQGYNAWDAKAQRIIDLRGFKADNDESQLQVARFEKHLKGLLEFAVKANARGVQFSLPVLAWYGSLHGNGKVAVIGQGKAKQRKAA